MSKLATVKGISAEGIEIHGPMWNLCVGQAVRKLMSSDNTLFIEIRDEYDRLVLNTTRQRVG